MLNTNPLFADLSDSYRAQLMYEAEQRLLRAGAPGARLLTSSVAEATRSWCAIKHEEPDEPANKQERELAGICVFDARYGHQVVAVRC